jgi:bifunctional UDP-N-acetylglucosamine pyrophosphorylase/glucosamine-1-phosphate N-acetyltransferase
MVLHAFLAVEAVAELPPVVVIGPGESGVQALIGDRAVYAVQPGALGPGHATMMAADALRGRADEVIVAYADMPLLRAETLRRLAGCRREANAAVALLSLRGEPDSRFGRIVRNSDGNVSEIVEAIDARQRADGEDILALREMNAGIYCFDGGWLWANIDRLPLHQGRRGPEYYLTDMVALAVAEGRTVAAIMTDDPDEGLGAETRAEMVAVERAFRRRVNNHWLANGVTLIEPDQTFIGPDVTIGQDTTIWPNTFLQGQTRIGEECVIGPNAVLRDTRIGHRCRVEQILLEKVEVPEGTTVRPGEWRPPPNRRRGRV